ncbi:TetR/AcrR family transcriptional regulator [Plantactinospora sp. CA-290183]|uniref:TetR/AcrR family transcriptional regulator n=1 Tax=Plantactinospora sp. CA-290183 TaxID=3240006 RepID=UPI003D8C3C98
MTASTPPGTSGSELPGTTEGRSTRKRREITDAALALFLRNGYSNTSMDQVAADARVSKQTVYKHFEDKERLFHEIVRGVTRNSDHILNELTAVVDDAPVGTAEELRNVLEQLARRYLDAVLQPHVISLRRLIIGEAERFPELADHYYQQAPARGFELIETALQRWVDQGLLAVPDLRLAATQLSYLALGLAQDRAQFHPGQTPEPAERAKIAKAAASTFLAAYRR